jgi:hypothetical protein
VIVISLSLRCAVVVLDWPVVVAVDWASTGIPTLISDAAHAAMNVRCIFNSPFSRSVQTDPAARCVPRKTDEDHLCGLAELDYSDADAQPPFAVVSGQD